MLVTFCQLTPLKKHKVLKSVLYTVRPSAGEDIAFICVVFILGNRTPFVVLATSNNAEAVGLVVPIPTLLLKYEKPPVLICTAFVVPFSVYISNLEELPVPPV